MLVMVFDSGDDNEGGDDNGCNDDSDDNNDDRGSDSDDKHQNLGVQMFTGAWTPP